MRSTNGKIKRKCSLWLSFLLIFTLMASPLRIVKAADAENEEVLTASQAEEQEKTAVEAAAEAENANFSKTEAVPEKTEEAANPAEDEPKAEKDENSVVPPKTETKSEEDGKTTTPANPELLPEKMEETAAAPEKEPSAEKIEEPAATIEKEPSDEKTEETAVTTEKELTSEKAGEKADNTTDKTEEAPQSRNNNQSETEQEMPLTEKAEEDSFDNTTSFPDGIYEAANEGMILYENPRGLLTLYCLRIRVEGGRAYGLIGSTSVGYEWIASGSENAAHNASQPVSDAKGTSAKTETEIPVRLNEEMTIYCKSSRGVSSYQITILAAEPTPSPTDTPAPTDTPEPTDTPVPGEDDGKIQNQTTLENNTYEPDNAEETIITDPDVRATLRCREIRVRDGRVYAVIYFSTNNYDRYTITHEERNEEGVFDVSGEHSEAEIPVVFDEEMTLTAHRVSNDKEYSYPILIKRPESMPEEAENPEETPIPTETPTPTPTETPAPKPTVTPTPTPTDIPIPPEDPKATKTVISKDGDYKINTVPLDEEEKRAGEKGLHHLDMGGLGRFRVVDCVLHVKGDTMTATITLSGTGYGYLYMGSKSSAEKAEAAAGGDPAKMKGVIKEKGQVKNSLGSIGSQFEIPITSLDKEIYFAARGRSSWYQRGIIIKSDGLPVKTVEYKEDQKEDIVPDKNDPSGKSDGQKNGEKDGEESDQKGGKDSEKGKTGGSTGAVDNSTAIPDGIYKPDSFSWSGGNGHINITCDQVEIRGGKAYARITITSGYYQYVKAGGGTHYTTHGSGTSTAVIPVELNKNNRILALTTKLSQPYEIAYTIFVGLSREGKKAEGVSENRNEMDEEAPAIPGIENGEEVKTEYSDLLKIFRYDKDYILLEINISEGTGYYPENKETSDDENAKEPEYQAEDSVTEDEDAVTAADLAVRADAELKADVYRHKIVKYLIVPDGEEVPAGMEKEVVIIRHPVDSVSDASRYVLSHLSALHLLEKITSVGLENAENEEETAGLIREWFPSEPELEKLASRIENSSQKPENEILLSGNPADPDFRTLVALRTGIVFVDSSILPLADDEKTAETKKEQYEKLTALAAQLGIPYVIWRSQDEVNDLAGAEWYKAAGYIFGCEEEAEKLFLEIENSASKEEKEEAKK